MNSRAPARLGALAILLALLTPREAAHAQEPLAHSAEARARQTTAIAMADLRAGITVSPRSVRIRLDTVAAGAGSHRRAHALRGAEIGAVAGAAAGIVAADLIISADRRHPERHGGVADNRPSARFYLMGILGVLGAGGGALTGATVGALIP